MTTCCTDSSIIMIVWMYSGGKTEQSAVTHTDTHRHTHARTLLLFAVDGATQQQLQHPAQLGSIAVFADQVNVRQREVVDVLAEDLQQGEI